MIRGRYINQGEPADEALRIRQEVFVEEQKIDPAIEYDGLDGEAVHAVVYDEENQPAATGRLLWDVVANRFRIGRVATRKERRGCGYGDFVMRMLMDKAFQCGAEEVYVEAQETAVPFYQKLGFEITGGELMDAGILHFPMTVKKGCVLGGCDASC